MSNTTSPGFPATSGHKTCGRPSHRNGGNCRAVTSASITPGGTRGNGGRTLWTQGLSSNFGVASDGRIPSETAAISKEVLLLCHLVGQSGESTSIRPRVGPKLPLVCARQQLLGHFLAIDLKVAETSVDRQ